MKICLAVPCGWTDRHNEANSCFSQGFVNAPKNEVE